MAAVTTGAEIKDRMLEGKGFYRQWVPLVNGSLTAGVALSGHFTNALNCNTLGTTYPGTLVGFPLPPSTDDLRLAHCDVAGAAAMRGWIGYMYRFGTANLTSTVGNRLTHDSTFTRIRRTRYGTANSNIPLIPFLYVTTASTTTQCIYTFDYVDQDGNSVTSQSNRLPAATTNAQGLYSMMPANADHAVLDITAVTVSTATTAGVASIYGFEPLIMVNSPYSGGHSYNDSLYGCLSPVSIIPAGVDSGSVTSLLCFVSPVTSTSQSYMHVTGFNNT